MIQRIQTVYLVLSAILLSLMFFFPIAEIKGDVQSYEFSAFGFASVAEDPDALPAIIETNVVPLYVWIGILVALIIFSIAQFKKRKTQLKLNRLIFLLTVGLIVFLFYEADRSVELFSSSTNPLYKAGLYFAFAALPLLFLANRGIKKDEDLIKSLERIR
ncbi:MAG: DUF4293 domain-containing protein [Flavobacteriales bacterium]|nr:DUF4293 domain-containing protein [Flavobacteriales bacterium]